MPLHLIALATAAFSIGSSEYVMVGLLPNVAADLGVDIEVAGLLISVYAIGVAAGAPTMAILTARLPRKTALIGLLCIFVAGNVLCALAPSYNSLIVARLVTAFCNGAFFGISAVVAADLAPHERRSSAIALMFTGMTLANVVGVPLGTQLGQAMGWRNTYWVISVIGLCAVLALARWLPRHIPMHKGELLREFRFLGDIRVLWPLVVSILASAANLNVLAYISPMLQNVTGVPERSVTAFLFLFGLGLSVGSIVAGKLGDRNLEASLRWTFFCLALVFLALSGAMHATLPMAAVVFIWGGLAFALVPFLQTLVVNQAQAAPNLASTLNQSAFNLGNGVGAWLGSTVLAKGYSLTFLPWISAILATSALLLAVWGTRYYGCKSSARASDT